MTQRRAPAFLIVGTPRSGTTLVQRLAGELRDVRLPIETHFFSEFYPWRFTWRFPLDAGALREALTTYARMKNTKDAGLDVEAVVADLGGGAAGPLDLFDAIVRELAGEAIVYGEKTPTHLPWWERLTRADPALRIVIIVRDPRDVVASMLALPWGPKRPDGYALAAERWALDQRESARALKSLPPDRVLLLRYEDVVRDPDGTRNSIAELVGVAADGSEPPARGTFILPREGWKARAVEEITAASVGTWEASLGAAHGRSIEAIAYEGMTRFGYATGLDDLGARRARHQLGTSITLRRWRLRLRTKVDRAKIARTRVW